jgi:AraC-like DNA-binding protein
MTIDGYRFQRLCRARDWLCDTLDGPPTNLRSLARAAGVSPYHLLRVFRDAFGETPHEYVTRIRIERAKAALRAGKTVTETCFDVGFSSVGSFSALFKRSVGVAPSEYQRRVRIVVPSSHLVAAVAVPFCFFQAFVPAAPQIAILEKPLPFRP